MRTYSFLISNTLNIKLQIKRLYITSLLLKLIDIIRKEIKRIGHKISLHEKNENPSLNTKSNLGNT